MSALVSSSDEDRLMRELLVKLSHVKRDIETSITNMESSKKSRDLKRKEIVLREMKLILAKLDEEDKKVMGELKSEAFDLIRECSKFEEELGRISGSASKTTADQVRVHLRSLQRAVDHAGFTTFVDCLNLSVGSGPPGSLSFMEDMTDHIFLKTPSFSGKSFMLMIPEKTPQFDKSDPEIQPHYLDVQVHGHREGPELHPFLLKRLVVRLSCVVQGSLGTSRTHCLEESSLWSKLEKKEGKMVDKRTLKFFIKRPKNTVCKISVKLLTSNISNSPLSYQFLNEAQTEQTTTASLAVNETGIEIFDNDVDHYGLTLMSDQSRAGYGNMMEKFPPVLSSLTSPRISLALAKPPAVLPPVDLSPFRPPVEGVSTMKASDAGTLAEALELVGSDGLEYQEEEGQEKSILDPSKRSNLSVEDMQRSLSGSESGERSSLGLELESKHNKSHVSFATRCSLVSVVATPQVAASGERFLVSDGQTKEEDGQAGLVSVRRLGAQVGRTFW